MDLRDLKGVGEKTYTVLKEKGINSVKSLLYTFPASYEIHKLSSFSYFDEFNAKGTVISPIETRKFKSVSMTSFDVAIDDLEYKCCIFNQPYVSKTFKVGSEVAVIGKWNKEKKRIDVSKMVSFDNYKEGIFPEYRIDGITNASFSKIVKSAFDYYEEKENLIPDEYYYKYGYKTGKDLLYSIHFPVNEEDLKSSMNALRYYELLAFSIKMAIIRENAEKLRKIPKKCDINKVKGFINAGIPFELTQDQKNAVNDIYKIFESNIPLNMLLEGDVGSGKTIVAMLSSYACATSGYQSLIIAPTEALASQHYSNFKKMLEPFDVNIDYLSSSVSTKERRTVLENLKSGKTDIIIGTHSLLSDDVIFKNLGFVVCDEQHKFGVDQRKKLKEKGNNPDVLYMTATPIPRTLALTMFDDMTLETIKSTPSNRKNVKTYAHTFKEYIKVLEFVHNEIKEGRQAYFVASCIENNPDDEYKSVEKVKEDLEKYYVDLKIGLLHGKLDSVEKADVLNKFKNRELDILVSTTVIEVGIDNPNASCMVIIDANKFGLSTLHQLRGRVGRGEYEGYCFLMVESKEYLDKLEILTETQDGFKISEQDLIDRGPGDFLGEEQSGMIKFYFANIFRDKEILKNAQKDAKELIKNAEIKTYYEERLYSTKFD